MPLTATSKYPSRRTYVLKVSNDATPDALAGFLENIVTGRKLQFASGLALLDAIAGELGERIHELPERSPGDGADE